jgi:protein ImuB
MFACIYIPNASAETLAAVLECARTFSPRVENTRTGAVVFDADGLERLFGGYCEITEKIRAQIQARGLEPNVAVAANADAAVCAARGFKGLTVIARGTEAARLHDLPLEVLAPSPEIMETLQRWGIRTLGAFARLPAVQVAERLGQEGVKLHKRAQGAGARPIVPHAETVRFVEVMDLDYDITTIEPLTFILSRMLEQICTRLQSRNLATHEVRLALGNIVRVLNLPLPVRNARLLTKLLILDLEADPPGSAVKRVEVEAFPAKPRVVQNGLFVPLSPEPEKLELTLARLKAVVGEENVGAAEILDTHRPDSFSLTRFGVSRGLHESRGNHPRNTRGHRPHLQDISLTLRLFRPPLDATVQLRNQIPCWIAFHGAHGSIHAAGGPWRTSGDWWRPTMWDREEWDIEAADTLYRIYYDVHLDRWYAQGVYD